MARLAEPPASRGAELESGAPAATVETLVVAGGQHSWLYEQPVYRRAVARMLAAALGGPFVPGRGWGHRRRNARRAHSRCRDQVRGDGGGRQRPPHPGRWPSRAPRSGGPETVWPPTNWTPPPRKSSRPRAGCRRRPDGRRGHERSPTCRRRDRPEARDPPVPPRPTGAGPPRPDPRRRPPCRQQQEPPALDVHRLPRPRAPPRAVRPSGRSPATSPVRPPRSRW